MKTAFAYFGGKSGMAEALAAMLPPHRVYIEPFFGSGAVFFAKPRAVHEIVNDLDGAVVAFYRCLRDRLPELEEACSLTPYAREEYDAADCGEAVGELELARRFWVRVNQGFAKHSGPNTGFSVTTARTQAAPMSVFSRLGRFTACAARLAGVTIECCDAAGLVERMATADSVVYVDPPYVGRTRVGRSDGTTDYRCDMPGPDEHRRLAAVLHACPGVVVLSGYPGDLYDELYHDWWHHDFEVTAFSSNSRRGDRTGRIERVWSNRDLLVGHAPQLALDGPV